MGGEVSNNDKNAIVVMFKIYKDFDIVDDNIILLSYVTKMLYGIFVNDIQNKDNFVTNVTNIALNDMQLNISEAKHFDSICIKITENYINTKNKIEKLINNRDINDNLYHDVIKVFFDEGSLSYNLRDINEGEISKKLKENVKNAIDAYRLRLEDKNARLVMTMKNTNIDEHKKMSNVRILKKEIKHIETIISDIKKSNRVINYAESNQ